MNVERTEMRFGLEFSCSLCGTTSVLTINSLLHYAREGDLVCANCGRLTASGARYCQCGAALLTTCEKCLQEFATAHRICDHCAWPNGLELESADGLKLQVQLALKNASSRNPDWFTLLDAVSKGEDHLQDNGPQVAEHLLNLLRMPSDQGYYPRASWLIAQIGKSGVDAVP